MVEQTLRTVFVRNDDSYRSVVDYVTNELRNNSIVPLLGAGISLDKPSNLPLANDLIRPLILALAYHFNDRILQFVRECWPNRNDSYKSAVLR